MSDLTFAILMRLIWIDAALVDDDLNRADLCAAFGISVPQASKDLQVFHGAFPRRLEYDRSRKVYRAAKGSRAVYPGSARVYVQRATERIGDLRKGGAR